jgi:hypothetical protein
MAAASNISSRRKSWAADIPTFELLLLRVYLTIGCAASSTWFQKCSSRSLLHAPTLGCTESSRRLSHILVFM